MTTLELFQKQAAAQASGCVEKAAGASPQVIQAIIRNGVGIPAAAIGLGTAAGTAIGASRFPEPHPMLSGLGGAVGAGLGSLGGFLAGHALPIKNPKLKLAAIIASVLGLGAAGGYKGGLSSATLGKLLKKNIK